ncbi:MAG: hypothetical protein QM702_03400 [Rubrivivax sp.]
MTVKAKPLPSSRRRTRASRSTPHAALLTACTLALIAGPAQGVVRTWNGTSGGVWGIAGNWTPNGLPGSTDTATFTDAATVRTIDLGTNRTVGDLAFTGASTYRLNGQTLTLQTGNLASTGGGSHRFTSNVGLNASGVWGINGGAIELTGTINSAYGITKQGSGSLRFAGATNTLQYLRAEAGSVVFDEGTFALTSTTSDAYTALWAAGSTVNIGHGAASAACPAAASSSKDRTRTVP